MLPAPYRARMFISTSLATIVVLSGAVGCSATTSPNSNSGISSTAQVDIPEKDGPGVTSDTITISWGPGAIATPDDPAAQKRQRNGVQAVVDEINLQGGVAGRKVLILDPDPTVDLVAQRQQAVEKNNFLALPDPSNGVETCNAYAKADFFAVLEPPLVSDPLGTPAAAACLNKAGHPVVGTTSWSSADFNSAPATAGFTLTNERFIDGLIAAGSNANFFSAGASTGVITNSDNPNLVDKTLLQSLEKAGVTNPQVFPLSTSATPSEVLNLVIKMKSAGVDHVIFGATSYESISLVLETIPVMQNQQYEPKILSLGGIVFEALKKSVDITPALASRLFAYSPQQYSDPVSLSDQQRATPAGKVFQTVLDSNPDLPPQVTLIDGLLLIKAALAASGSEYVNAEAFTVGLSKLGASYQSPQLYHTNFGPAHHDGGAGVKKLSYDSGCGCGKLGNEVITF